MLGGQFGTDETGGEAEKMTAHLRKDGSVERMEGSGGVWLSNKDGGVVTAPEGEVRMNSAESAESAMLRGGVRYGGGWSGAAGTGRSRAGE